jgi:hypothetical protein
MKPGMSPIQDPQASLFGVPLEKIVNPPHPSVILAGKIKWERFEKELGSRFRESNGRKMFGEGGMEKLLSGTIAVGFEMKAIAGKSLENVNIDATV